jgi:hypothetical protein
MVAVDSGLTLRLLGPPAVRWQGEALALPTRKSLALLCYLAVWPGTVSRGELAESAFEWRSSPANLSDSGKVVTHGSSCAPVTVPWCRLR